MRHDSQTQHVTKLKISKFDKKKFKNKEEKKLNKNKNMTEIKEI